MDNFVGNAERTYLITMEKRLPVKSPQLPEKYPSGCRWGLTSFFDLFGGPSSRKLISNVSRTDRLKKEDNCAGHHPKLLPASVRNYQEDKNIAGIDRRYASVYNSRKGKHKQCSSNGIGCSMEENGKMKKFLEHSTCHEEDAKHPGSWKLNSANRVSQSTLMEVFCGFGCKSIRSVNEGATCMKVQSAHVTDTAEAVANRKFINQTSNESKQLLEALEILDSKKNLILKLLEDPNSVLSRHIKDLRGSSQGARPRTELFMRQHKGNGGSYGSRKENRLSPSSALKRNRFTKPLNRIVILKPQSEISVRNKVPVFKQSYFPFRRLRRKLRWAQQKKGMSSQVEAEAASARKGSHKNTSRRPLSSPEDDFSSYSSPERSGDYAFVGAPMRIRPHRSCYQVKDDCELRLLGESTRSLSSLLRLNVDPLSSEFDERSDDQSDCLDTSSDFVRITETQETSTTVVHTSCDESTETKIAEEEPSSSPRNIQEAHDPVSRGINEDQLKYDGTDSVIEHSTNDDLRSAIDYVKAVLVAADLDWDRLLLNSHEDQILWQSVFDEVKVPCNRSDIDQRLIFDYINEVLQKVHGSHQMKIRALWVEKNMIRAVMKRVHRDRDQLLQKGSPTLDQLVCKDLAYFGTWIDVPGNTEEIVTELVEDILDDIVSEI